LDDPLAALIVNSDFAADVASPATFVSRATNVILKETLWAVAPSGQTLAATMTAEIAPESGRTFANVPPAAVYRIQHRRAEIHAFHGKHETGEAKRFGHRAGGS